MTLLIIFTTPGFAGTEVSSLGIVLLRSLVAVTNTQGIQFKERKHVFWFMVWKFPVHGWLALWLINHGKVDHHGRREEVMEKKLIITSRKQTWRDQEGVSTRSVPYVQSSTNLLPPAGQHLWQFPKPPEMVPPAGDRIFAHKLWDTFQQSSELKMEIILQINTNKWANNQASSKASVFWKLWAVIFF